MYGNGWRVQINSINSYYAFHLILDTNSPLAINTDRTLMPATLINKTASIRRSAGNLTNSNYSSHNLS